MTTAKRFTPNAPRVEVAQAASTSSTQKPALVRQAPVDKKGDKPSPRPYFPDRVTTLISGTVFQMGVRVFEDGCVDGFGRRYLFSRWYPQQRVIVDAFSSVNKAAQLEVERKSAFIRAYNETHKDAQIGYLPYIVPQANVSDDDAKLAAMGEVVALQAPLAVA